MKRLALLCLVASVCLALSACKKAEPKKEAKEAKETRKVYKVAVIPKGTSHVFWQSVHAGVKKAEADLKEAGIEVETMWQGPAKEGQREEQIRIVEDMILKKVDAIVLAPLDSKALVPVVERAAKANIPVVIFDSDIKTDKRVSFVATDNYLGGIKAAEAMGKILDGKGRVVLVMYNPGSDSTENREKGFRDGLKEKFPNMELVDEEYGRTTVESAKAVAEDLLKKHTNLDGVFACNESTAVGTIQALKAHGYVGKVKMVGFDCTPALQRALTEGVCDALIVQNPFRMGCDGVKKAIDHLKGKQVPGRVDTGVYVVTRENLKDPEIDAMVNPDLDRWLKE